MNSSVESLLELFEAVGFVVDYDEDDDVWTIMFVPVDDDLHHSASLAREILTIMDTQNMR